MPSPAILSVRVSADERSLLQSAADQARTNVSDFVRRKAIEAAELDMLERREFTIAADDWAKFESWAASPPQERAALRTLAAAKPLWES